MRKILIIARREFLETVKTRMFVISLLMGPLLFALMFFVGRYTERIMRSAVQPPREVGVIDMTGELWDGLSGAVKQRNAENPHQQITLRQIVPAPGDVDAQTTRSREDVAAKRLHALLVLQKGVIDGNEPASLHMDAKNMGEMMFGEQIRKMLNRVVVERRGARHGLEPKVLDALTQQVPLQQIGIGTTSNDKAGVMVRVMVPFVFMLFLYMGIMTSSGQLLTSVIEEKSTRVVEVILSAVSPMQFMIGKIVGLSAVALGTVAMWGLFTLAGAARNGLTNVLTPDIVTWFLVFFVLGYLLYACLFVAMGAACNSIKEAQTIMMPVNLLVIVPVVGWTYFSSNPTAFWTRLLSLFPPMTPMLMVLRLSAQPDIPYGEIALSIAALLLAVVLAMWAAARIFRTGILMYGKPPTLRELARWVRCG